MIIIGISMDVLVLARQLLVTYLVSGFHDKRLGNIL